MTGEQDRVKKRILLVDDDPDFVWILKEQLEADGFVVVTAMNGREALERLWATDPDMVLLDLHMPVMNGLGLEVLRAIRQATQPVPVITMTASTMQELAALSLKAGAFACLLKPFDYRLLKIGIESALKGSLQQ